MKFIKGEDLKYWGALAILIFILYYLFSSRQFSVIFTLSGTVQTFGFLLITLKITKSRSVAGLSRQTFISYTLVFLIRSILFMFFKGYLPYDSTGDFIFKIQQIIATILSGYILYIMSTKFKTSYNKDLDVVKSVYLIAIALVVAALFHPNLNRNFIADFSWAFSQYLQTICLFSQFILFNKKGGEIQSYTSHFIAAQAISRVLSLIFWIFTYSQLNISPSSTKKSYTLVPEYVGHCFMFAQVIHLLIMADFMYYWLKAIIRGKNVELPAYI